MLIALNRIAVIYYTLGERPSRLLITKRAIDFLYDSLGCLVTKLAPDIGSYTLTLLTYVGCGNLFDLPKLKSIRTLKTSVTAREPATPTPGYTEGAGIKPCATFLNSSKST